MSLLEVTPFTVATLSVGGGGASPPAPSGISLVGYSTYDIVAGTFDVTIHADALEDDIAIVHVGGRSGTNTWTPPAGYSGQQIFTYDEGGNTRHAAWWRRLGAGEATTTESWTTSNISRENLLGISFWRGCVASGDPQDQTHTKNSEYDSTPICPAITTQTDNAMVLYLLAQRYSGTAPTEDTAYPAATTGVYKQWFNPSTLGLAYVEQETAGVVAANAWGDWAGEANLAIVASIALKAA